MKIEHVARIAGEVLAGCRIGREDALRLADDRTDIYELLFHANRIRRHYRGDEVKACSIMSARTGACPEDCAFCAQSARWKTGIRATPMCSVEEVSAAAGRAARNGVYAFSLVASGRGVRSEEELKAWVERLQAIGETGVERHASLGTLNDEQIERLKSAGLTCYCHNIETSERFFPNICTTHTYRERLETARRIKRHGLRLCCGCLLGMGETWKDRVDLALALRDLGADNVPMNFLHRIPGTPLENREPMRPMEILRCIAVFRFILFDRDIGVYGGREENLRDMQSWIFMAGANAIMLGDYLTTRGRPPGDDLRMLEDLGLRLFRPLSAPEKVRVAEETRP